MAGSRRRTSGGKGLEERLLPCCVAGPRLLPGYPPSIVLPREGEYRRRRRGMGGRVACPFRCAGDEVWAMGSREPTRLWERGRGERGRVAREGAWLAPAWRVPLRGLPPPGADLVCAGARPWPFLSGLRPHGRGGGAWCTRGGHAVSAGSGAARATARSASCHPLPCNHPWSCLIQPVQYQLLKKMCNVSPADLVDLLGSNRSSSTFVCL